MTLTKRQVLPKGLWVVATPIGNLDDLSPRALQALQEAAGILCEDTRRTSTLCAALGINRPLFRVDAHVRDEVLEKAMERLQSGESLALVTDAGTPSISDPGSRLVEMALKAGVQVTPIPGPSAVVALLSVSGLTDSNFAFRGFFPRKTGERVKEISLCSDSAVARTFVWFESPERIVDSLASVAGNAPGAQVSAAKELTKIHEKIFAGGIADVLARVQAEIEKEGARGEWCFAVQFPELSEGDDKSSDWVKALQCLLDARVSASEAARQVSQHFVMPKNLVYDEAIKRSCKKTLQGG